MDKDIRTETVVYDVVCIHNLCKLEACQRKKIVWLYAQLPLERKLKCQVGPIIYNIQLIIDYNHILLSRKISIDNLSQHIQFANKRSAPPCSDQCLMPLEKKFKVA